LPAGSASGLLIATLSDALKKEESMKAYEKFAAGLVLATSLAGQALAGPEGMGRGRRRTNNLWRLLALVCVASLIALQQNARADVNDNDDGEVPAFSLVIDADQQRNAPVGHRFIHGSFDDATFQVALPATWNGKLIIMAKPITGNEFAFENTLKPIILRKNYAYAQSDEGWLRDTIAFSPEDSFLESRLRLRQLRVLSHQMIIDHYGAAASRTYLVGFSNGGFHTKGLLEHFPELFDGGIALAGYNSFFEILGWWTHMSRNLEIIAPRMADIIAKRRAFLTWDHITEPLSPPLTEMEIAALTALYTQSAELKNQFEFEMGAPRGSEGNWLTVLPLLLAHVTRALPSVDPTYDPDGDGTLSEAEAQAWTPTERPKPVQMRTLRKQDVSGGIGRPLLIGHGTLDFVVSTSESVGYKELVEKRMGPDLAAQLLRVYLLPGVGHNPIVLQTAFLNAAIDAVDAWVETGTPPGALPGATLEHINAVESHPVALAQCEKFFRAYPRLKRIAAEDTAGSVRKVMQAGDPTRAAIGSHRAAEIYGGNILLAHLEDDSENYTRFLLPISIGTRSTPD